MSDGLIGGAAAATDEPKAADQTAVSHIEKPAEAAPQKQDTNAWMESVTRTLYVEGDKPNYEMLPEKYWKDGVPDIQSAMKARSELEKAFSRGDHKAPAEYDLAFAKDAGIPDDDPLLGSYRTWAKENGISQDAFNKLAKNYIEMQTQAAQSMQVNIAAEKQKLGPNADKVIGEMVQWGQTMVKKGIWGPDDFDEFKIMGGTARGLNALMKVREYYGDMQKIPTSIGDTGGKPSRDELSQMIADPRYEKDPAFRSKVEKAFEEMYST